MSTATRRSTRRRTKALRRSRRQRNLRLEALEDRYLLTLGAFNQTGPDGLLYDTTPELTWEDSAGAASYDVTVSSASGVVQELTGLTATSATLDPLADGVYRAEVVARDGAGDSLTAANSDQAFAIQSAPPTSHMVFATSELKSVVEDSQVPPPDTFSFGSMDAAGYLCTFAAFNAGMLPNWNGVDVVYQAILSTENHDARDRLNISGPLYNMNGQLVATGSSDLWDGSIENPIIYDEFGNLIGSDFDVWSGTRKDGLWSGNSCGDWNISASTTTGTVGDVSNTTGWIQTLIDLGCNNSARLYGLSPAVSDLAIAAEPIADAGADYSIAEGDALTLDASATRIAVRSR